ncbi:MAG: Hpt domain-containing protein [Desulfobacterales bacterium]|nr:Hpt domain-containing protein [Desulfobacterales bacterium]
MSVINLDELKEIMDNDEELIQECFAEFLMDYQVLIKEIKTAIDQKDFQGIDDTAHKLKGTLRYLAAEPAATAAQVIEQAGRQQDLEGMDDKLAALESECRKVILYIDEFS